MTGVGGVQLCTESAVRTFPSFQRSPVRVCPGVLGITAATRELVAHAPFSCFAASSST